MGELLVVVAGSFAWRPWNQPALIASSDR